MSALEVLFLTVGGNIVESKKYSNLISEPIDDDLELATKQVLTALEKHGASVTVSANKFSLIEFNVTKNTSARVMVSKKLVE